MLQDHRNIFTRYYISCWAWSMIHTDAPNLQMGSLPQTKYKIESEASTPTGSAGNHRKSKPKPFICFSPARSKARWVKFHQVVRLRKDPFDRKGTKNDDRIQQNVKYESCLQSWKLWYWSLILQFLHHSPFSIRFIFGTPCCTDEETHTKGTSSSGGREQLVDHTFCGLPWLKQHQPLWFLKFPNRVPSVPRGTQKVRRWHLLAVFSEKTGEAMEDSVANKILIFLLNEPHWTTVETLGQWDQSLNHDFESWHDRPWHLYIPVYECIWYKLFTSTLDSLIHLF